MRGVLFFFSACSIVLALTLQAFAANENTLSTNAADQTSVAVTVYNSNLGLVKDQRLVGLRKGTVELQFMDVAEQIIPASVHISSISDPDGLQVLEQNYRYDLLNPQKLLDKYVGKHVKLYTKNPYTDEELVQDATLLSNNGGPIYKIGDSVTFGHPGRVLFPDVPEDLLSRPTLIWLLKNNASEQQKVEALYLTNGINWRADYVVTLNEKDDRADLTGWVTIDNRSGATYRNAQLKLVAGDVHRVREAADYALRAPAMAKAAMPAEGQFEQKELLEYKIYTLNRPSTINNNETKQISLVEAQDIGVRKEFLFKGANYYYYSQYSDEMPKQKVGVYVEIQNKKENNLGIPLPKGTIRVYKRDAEGSLQFVGEDSIDHTPKDEKVRIMLGEAFDVVGTRKQTEWKKLLRNVYEASYEISIRNHKTEDIVVKVLEPIPGDWTMVTSSHEYKKTNAFMAEFLIAVPHDGETKLQYTVRMKY